MGSGEPFDNFDHLIKFIEIVNAPEGLNIGQRHITVSTSGLAERICDFADRALQVTLAISLHAPNDEIRRSIMPIAKRYSIDELLQACKYYINATNRRITFEYSLIDGVNDSEDNARELGKRLRHMLCHVNLIPVNEIKENAYKKSTQEKVNNFAATLESFGIETTIRKKLGTDIEAACGQLRRSFLKKD
jgi:23S rRNA (adenine2503-C2)-methyltransferase